MIDTDMIDTLATDEEAIGTQATLRRKTRPQKGDRHFGRSAVTNGRRLHPLPTAGNATWQRRFKDVFTCWSATPTQKDNANRHAGAQLSHWPAKDSRLTLQLAKP